MYYVRNNVVYGIVRFPSDWSSESQPFGTVFNNVCCLHAQKNSVTAGSIPIIWREGASSPFNVSFGLTEHFVGSVVPPYSNMLVMPTYLQPDGGCDSLDLQCSEGSTSTGEILLFADPASGFEDDQSIEFNDNPMTGNSPTIFFPVDHNVQWGSVSDSVGTIETTTAPFSGFMKTGINVYSCPSSSTGCTSSYQLVKFVGTEIDNANNQNVDQIGMDVSDSFTQSANYRYTSTPYGSTVAIAGSGGQGTVDFGNPGASGDSNYMQVREVYGLWP